MSLTASEVFPSIHRLQWGYLRTKLKAACELRCLSLAAMSSSQSAYVQNCKYNVIHKTDNM